MKIKIEALTPLHIGSGEEISPSEYYIDKDSGQFVRLNMDALLLDPSFNHYREKFISEASKQRYIGSIIDASLLKKYPLYSISMSGGTRAYIASNQTTVKEYVKTAGRVFIPGSSLKGSMISTMIWHILRTNYKNMGTQINDLITRRPQNRKEEGEIYNDLMKLSLSLASLEPKQGRFTQWLNISDSTFKSPQGSLVISLARVKGAKRGGELPVLYETIKPGESFEMEISRVKSKFSEKELLEIAHNFYLKVLEHDRVDIDKEPYLLRLGQGSSAYSTSLLILAEELGIKNYRINPPRTRKRIDDTVAMGWIRIKSI
jgi:CRISPR type III-A-associated RAMP protein Csm5